MLSSNYSFRRTGLILELPDFLKINDMGIRKPLKKYIEGLWVNGVFQEAGCETFSDFERIVDREWAGGSFVFKHIQKDGLAHFHIVFCYEDSDDSSVDLFVAGHEEMHSYFLGLQILNLNSPDIIERNLRRLYPANSKLAKAIESALYAQDLSDEESEIIANCGGYIASQKQRRSTEEIRRILLSKTKSPSRIEQLNKALRLINPK